MAGAVKALCRPTQAHMNAPAHTHTHTHTRREKFGESATGRLMTEASHPSLNLIVSAYNITILPCPCPFTTVPSLYYYHNILLTTVPSLYAMTSKHRRNDYA